MKKLRAHLRKVRQRRQLAKHAKLRARADHDRVLAERKRKAENRLTKVIARIKIAIAKVLAERNPRFDTSMLNSCPAGITDAVKRHIAIAVAKFGMVVTATSNGGHAPGSYHYTDPCSAVDLWHSSVSTMIAFQRYVLEEFGEDAFNELFGPDGFYVKNGVRFEGHFPDHGDHAHDAPR